MVHYDSNLYQYHLLHGVLTVNEVRETLGLPAVPWGERPTGPGGSADNAPSSGSGDSTNLRSRSGDADGEEAEDEQDETKNDRRER